MEEYNLFSSNNNFMKPKGQLWTLRLSFLLLIRLYWLRPQNCVFLNKVECPFINPIQWKQEVSSNPSLSKSLTVAVYNRFQALSQNQDLVLENLEDTYSNTTKATVELALDIISKKQKRKRYEPENSSYVTTARDKLKMVSLEHDRSPTSLKKVIAAKKYLDDAYLSAEDDYINDKFHPGHFYSNPPVY